MWKTIDHLGEEVITDPVTNKRYNVLPGNQYTGNGLFIVFSPNWDKSIAISLDKEVWYKPDEATPYAVVPGGIAAIEQDLVAPE